MIDPILFQLGPLQVRWYGLIFALMFLIGAYIAGKLAKYRNLTKEDAYDFLIWLIPFAIIGARLAHIFIYNSGYYLENPIDMLKIWNGGVSIHGGVIGAVIAGLIFCKRKKIKFYDLADIFVVPLSFGIIFGRIGNFINQELYGRLTNVSWAITYEVVEGKRHPSQIYEAIMHLIIFLILLWMITKKKFKSGVIFWSFVTIYSFFRFIAEFFRDAKIIGYGMTMPQYLSIGFFLLGIFMLLKDKFINKGDNKDIKWD